MKTWLSTSIGRLRLLAFLEGSSLLFMVFVSVPLRVWGGNNALSQVMGPLHGALFLLFVLNTLRVAVEQGWQFWKITWKVLLACLIPFGTFYIDYAILRKLAQ